jgi:methyl-accepting chemotaxis protein
VEQIARATDDVRTRTREAVAAVTQVSKRSGAVAQHVDDVVEKLSQIRHAYDEQLAVLDTMLASLDAPTPGSAEAS